MMMREIIWNRSGIFTTIRKEAKAHGRHVVLVCDAHWESGRYNAAGPADPAGGRCDCGGGYAQQYLFYFGKINEIGKKSRK